MLRQALSLTTKRNFTVFCSLLVFALSASGSVRDQDRVRIDLPKRANVFSSDMAEPFRHVKVGVPFNVRILPSTSGETYSVDIDASEDVRRAFRASVSPQGELRLESHHAFETRHPIKVTGRV